MSQSTLRYSVRRNTKAEYGEWHRFKRIVDRLRTRHGYNLTRLSLALGNERTWLKSALQYPFQLSPREYETARTLLRQETKPMTPGTTTRRSGPTINKREGRELRQLLMMARERGIKMNQIGEGSRMLPNSISSFLNNPKKTIRASVRDDILGYLKTVLPAEAFETPHANGAEPPEIGHGHLVSDPKLLAVVRRLFKTIRHRGTTVSDMARGMSWAPTSMSTWLNNDKGTTYGTFNRMLSYIRTVLPIELIRQAFTEGNVPLPAEYGGETAQIEASTSETAASAPEPEPQSLQASFASLLAKLQAAREEFDALIAPLPARARLALEENIGEMIDSAMLELTTEEMPRRNAAPASA